MSVVSEETVEDVKVENDRRRSIGGSMSSKTRKLGRRLTRSVSIVALKIPEKAHNLTRSSSKLIRPSSKDKKSRNFELSVILPDKTQRQVTITNGTSVATVISEILHELGMQVPGSPSGPISAPLPVPLGAPLPAPVPPKLVHPPSALLYLGGCRAPVDPKASASTLEGEVLIIEEQPIKWDGRNLENFLAWESIYASTLNSALELFGKPLLRAAALTHQEYHLLFHYLESVAQASFSLTVRMRKYLDSGLLKNEELPEGQDLVDFSGTLLNRNSKSILNELVQEGLLTERDIEISSEITSSEFTEKHPSSSRSDDDKSRVSMTSETRNYSRIGSHRSSVCENHANLIEDDKLTTSSKRSSQCYNSHRNSSNFYENIWADMHWNFLGPEDFGYDQLKRVIRSQSESCITPLPPRKDEIYETLREHDIVSSGSVTPYESIEDLYDCIKNPKYDQMIAEEMSSVVNSSESKFPDVFFEKSSLFNRSHGCESSHGCQSDSSGSNKVKEEALMANDNIFRKSDRSIKLPPTSRTEEESESAILLKQLFTGELSDAYEEFLSVYPYARTLLRKKIRYDEHFIALAEIRRGAAQFTIADYMELPIERLAQYERLVGASGCSRRRGARLSDLERIQDQFPHDYLALHEHDPPSLLSSHNAQKATKSLRKRPSLDLNGTVSPGTTLSPRTFIMEAPVQLCPIGASAPALERSIFLFSDLLIIGKSRGNSCFKLKESVRLSETWISLLDSEDTGFLLGWPTTSGVSNYLAVYPTQAARDTWYRKIQNALSAQLAAEPKSTNIQVIYKDMETAIEFCKTICVSPEMTATSVLRSALAVLQNNNVEGDSGRQDGDSVGGWGSVRDWVLCVRAGRESAPHPLHGAERPHAIQMSKIRQTLSNEDGFDLEHVNAKNNPCGLVFELRKKICKSASTGAMTAAGRGLRLLRRGGGGGGAARLWGVALTRVCGGAPPPLLLQLMRRLRQHAPNTHGVFRRSANAKALRLLRDKMDALGPWAECCSELDRAPVLLLAALLKDYFRSLPQPLLCRDLYQSWIALVGLQPAEKITAVRSLLLKMPKPHYTMLSYFICLLAAIAKKSNVNLMCPMNLGVCVGPSLLWPSAPCDKAPKAVPMIIEHLIVKAEALFGPQIMTLLGSGSPESSNALLDSGAEESDSLHSVGISLDSMELSSPRKEKLSLSRDSGLTLSEDDSNSNGGNSPAPRNILHSLSVPTCVNLQQNSRYTTDTHNINGLPPINHRQNIYSNKNEVYDSIINESQYSSPYSTERYVHNSINVGISNGKEEKYVAKTRNTTYNNGRENNDIYGGSPAKYITGLEPQKPPRSNMTKTARTSKVFSMFSESQETETKNHINKIFNRAKSTDNLLDIKQEPIENRRDLISSQENILYSNIHDLTLFAENIQRQRSQYQAPDILANTNYSRVYTEWDKRRANYTATKSNPIKNDCVYDHLPQKREENKPNKLSETQAATIFTRNDWTRQAARTKSLESNEDTYVTAPSKRNAIYETQSIACRKRRYDPSHLCTKNCGQPPNVTHREQSEKNHINPLQTSYSYIDAIHHSAVDNKKMRQRHINNQRLSQSKSLANIILQSDSSSSDTLYQPQNSFNSRSTDSPASENSFDNYNHIEPVYNAIYGRQRDIFIEDKLSNSSVYSSDIYTATPTSVQPEYADKEQNSAKLHNLPPPVPPRKMLYNKVLKKFPPVHVAKDDKSRSKSVPPAYRDPPVNSSAEVDVNQKMLSLDCSDTDTESESYV